MNTLCSRALFGDRETALLAIAADLESNAESLMAENAKDLAAGREKGLEPALLDRLDDEDDGRLVLVTAMLSLLLRSVKAPVTPEVATEK